MAASGGSDVDAMSRWECAVGVEREVGKDLERRSRREWLKLAKAAAATAQGESALGEAYPFRASYKRRCCKGNGKTKRLIHFREQDPAQERIREAGRMSRNFDRRVSRETR